MKILSPQEAEEIKLKLKKRTSKSDALNREILEMVDKLSINQSCIFYQEDWKTKSTPQSYIPITFIRWKSPKKFSISTLIDDLGWVVTRKE